MPDPIPKSPREHDEEYLQFIRSLPCCICQDNTSTEPHHPRVGSINDGKPYTGGAEKASDKWALPLCSRHHRELHSMGDAAFWASWGIDPFAMAMHYRRRPR